jgi:hypothetical protein
MRQTKYRRHLEFLHKIRAFLKGNEHFSSARSEEWISKDLAGNSMNIQAAAKQRP